MPNYTRKAILDTFEEMLTETPLKKITVSALVARVEISPNTFYYHFRDIYDLLEKWLETKVTKILDETANFENWSDVIKHILHWFQDNPKLVYHIINSISKEQGEKYVYSIANSWFLDYFKSQHPELDEFPEILESLSKMYLYSLLGFLLEFVMKHMNEDIDKMVDTASPIYDGVTEYVVKKLIDEKKSTD